MFGVTLSRRFGQVLNGQRNISTVAIIGAGVMGQGIGMAAAIAGNRVLLYDLTQEFLNGAKSNIHDSVHRGIRKRGNMTDTIQIEAQAKPILDRIEYTTDIQAAFDNTELAIEAIFENLQAKRKLFALLEKHADHKTIFGTNSVSLAVPEIAFESPRKDRFCGIHFSFPVHKTEKVEIVRLNETSQETFKKVTEWVESLGKNPQEVSRRSPEVNFTLPPQPEFRVEKNRVFT